MDNGENEQIIRGDLFSGLVVSEPEDRDYHFTIDGTEVTVSQRVQIPKEDRKVLGFLFLMDKPVRFRLDILVPEDCEAKYTPLRPGVFQSLNFRWESGDVLKCFFYY